MKRIISILLVLLLSLTGCASQQAQPATEIVAQPSESLTIPAPTLQETEPVEALATQPLLPMEALLQSMTTEEKVGQLFLAAHTEKTTAEDIAAYHLGGYILFGRFFRERDPETAAADIAAFQQQAKIPLLIAVDEEGGTVNRVSCYQQYRQEEFGSPRELYAQGGLAAILENEQEKCALLRSLGINVNMAPVCDITTDRASFMYKRSLGEGPEETAAFVTGIADVMERSGIGAVLKHFPGYGDNTDTHTGIAVDARPLVQLEKMDLVPFAAGIEADCDAILVSHTFINCLDTAYPATLSPKVHWYLREIMGFEGVIVTDELSMEAITDLYGVEEAAVLSVLAGNDLLCTQDYVLQYGAVLEAVRSGRIPEAAIDRAVTRILQWKYDLGLLG